MLWAVLSFLLNSSLTSRSSLYLIRCFSIRELIVKTVHNFIPFIHLPCYLLKICCYVILCPTLSSPAHAALLSSSTPSSLWLWVLLSFLKSFSFAFWILKFSSYDQHYKHFLIKHFHLCVRERTRKRERGRECVFLFASVSFSAFPFA